MKNRFSLGISNRQVFYIQQSVMLHFISLLYYFTWGLAPCSVYVNLVVVHRALGDSLYT